MEGGIYVVQCDLLFWRYSKFRHLCNRLAALKKPPCVLCKLFLHSCLWLIKLTTTVVLVLAIAKVPESAVMRSVKKKKKKKKKKGIV